MDGIMADITHRDLNEIKIALKLAPKIQINSRYQAIIGSGMTWHATGTKTLSEPMIALVIDAYMHNSVPMIWYTMVIQRS